MRIAFVAPLDAPTCDTTARGDAVVVGDLARAMRTRGHEVMVFCAPGSYLAGIDTAPVLAGEGYAEVLWHVERWMPDVVSAHALEADGGLRGVGIPYIHTLHANPVAASIGPDGAHVAASIDSARRWRAAGATVHAIPHGVPAGAPVVAPEGFALIAGRIAREKGTAIAIRAARRAGLEAVVVGELCDRAYFAREIAPSLRGVRVVRTLPRGRVMALMARAAVLVTAAQSDEPFSLVAAEAQRIGCPVVGFARGAMSEIVGEGAGVLVPPNEEEALADAIPIARALDRQSIRRAASPRFAIDAMADEHERLLATASSAVAPARRAA